MGVGKWEVKDSNNRDHRMLILRCVSKDLVPVSVRLKSTSNSRSRRVKEIIHQAENSYFRIGFSASMVFFARMPLSFIGAGQHCCPW